MPLYLFTLAGCCLSLSLCLSTRGQTSSKASSGHPRETDEDKDPIAIVELGATTSWNFSGGAATFAPNLAAEVTPVENWLELEAGVSPFCTRKSTEWDTELRRCDKVLLAVVNSHRQTRLAQHCCWRKSDLAEPYPKGVRDFETVWHLDGHYFSLWHFVWKQSRCQDIPRLADYRFGFQVLLQPENPALATNPRLFEPTKGSKRIVT